jgi:hypothetical protein
MRLRRRQVRHDANATEALFAHLGQLRPELPASPSTDAAAVPIFIVGMPRTGTTLLERILGNHSQVADAGELHDFVWQLRWMCNRGGGAYLDLDLARAAEGIEFAELGRRYLEKTRWRTRGKAFFTDKMPANFVNVGYILRALPQARILHMTRDPMDTCFSNLREHFAAAYAHSYDQVEMADYYRQYRQLMAHWRSLYPERILDVRYGELTVEPEVVSRKVMEFCGLPWEEGVADVDRRSGTVATASAVQVREPIHQRFAERWRTYEQHLRPMRERLGSYAY